MNHHDTSTEKSFVPKASLSPCHVHQRTVLISRCPHYSGWPSILPERWRQLWIVMEVRWLALPLFNFAMFYLLFPKNCCCFQFSSSMMKQQKLWKLNTNIKIRWLEIQKNTFFSDILLLPCDKIPKPQNLRKTFLISWKVEWGKFPKGFVVRKIPFLIPELLVSGY